MNTLELHHVSKSFGSHTVLNDLSFSVPAHSIYGFIGQNGAGKTTTMKLILGLYAKNGGEILVNGEAVHYGQTKTNRHIGYLPDVPEFYGYMTPFEYLNFCAEITGIKSTEKKDRINELLTLVGLSGKQKRIQGFSRGMKQRLGIAQALLNKPQLLICDEPTSALDPVGRKEILDILVAVKDTTTVLFSTHILSDVEKICDHIGLLNNGSLAYETSMDDIRNNHSNHGFYIDFLRTQDAEHFLQSFQPVCTDVARESATRLVYAKQHHSLMIKAMSVMAEENICPLAVERIEPNLEQLFMEVVEHETTESLN